MTESRIQRWARKKAETRQDTQVPAPEVETPAEVNPAEQELAVNQTLSEQALLAKYDLPDPDALEQGTDITGFLRKEIPEFLRRKALRSLWRSNPLFGVLDGLNEYDEDFSKVTTPLGGVKTAYKVGKGGFLDLEKRERERQEQALTETAEDTVRVSEPERPLPQDVEDEDVTLGEQAFDEGQISVASTPIDAPETEAAPRYRPRMQFESR